MTAFLAAYNYDWDIFFRSVFSPDGLILGGVAVTLSVAIVSQAIGVILGIFAALGRMSRFTPFRVIARIYIWLFRGTPLLVQIAFLYFGLAVTGIYKFPDIEIRATSRSRATSRPGSSPSASTRARTCPRSCAPGSCPSTAARWRPPGRSG